MAIAFRSVVPTFTTQDLDSTTAFYCEKLGFEVNYSETSGLFRSFTRGETFVHFAQTDLAVRSNREGWCDRVKPADVSFFVDDVKSLYEAFTAKGVRIAVPPTERPYGIIDFDVVDVNGYVLRFNETVR